jgi:hypothetical protein
MRTDRGRNKGEEDALGALMKKMILLLEMDRNRFFGCHVHERGMHCQKRF